MGQLHSEIETSGNTCAFCGIRVDIDSDETHSEIISWVAGHKKDRAVLRTYTGRYGCKSCINKTRSGMGADQQEIFDAIESRAGTDSIIDDELFETGPCYERREPRFEVDGSFGSGGSYVEQGTDNELPF